MTVVISPTLRPVQAWVGNVIGGNGHHTQMRRGCELTLASNTGLVGFGEASPLPHYSTEQFNDVETELTHLSPIHVALPERPSRCRVWLERRSAECGCHSPSARFAFEGALLDICSKHFGLSAASLIGQMLLRNIPRDGLAASKLLFGSDAQSLGVAARHAVSRGYRTVKIKLGCIENFEREWVALASLRQTFGPELKLRLDPNQGWPVAEVPRILDELARLDPELVEEPAAANDMTGLGGSPVPLALDESLRCPGVLEAIAPHIARLNIRAVVLKPALLGLLRSIELAERANGLGLEIIVTHLFDGPIGHATATSLALAIGSSDFAHGLAPHPGLRLDPQRRVLGLGGGRITPMAQLGLPLSGIVPC